jgi:hypothetical protein
MLRIEEQERLLLSHLLVPAGPIPSAQDPDGVYPYESYVETSRRPVLRRYRFVVLENDYLRVTICPDLGGRVFSLITKPSGREVLSAQPVVRPMRILPRQGYIGGGIEISFPIAHTPSLLESVLCRHEWRDGRGYVWCGERELRFGMHWTIEFSLGEGEPFLAQRSRFHNPTRQPHPWMSWANAGVPARPDTELHFPTGEVLYHGERISTIDWEKQGPRRQGDIHRMSAFFWRQPAVNAFGAFTPSLGIGLYHIADDSTPGMKLWSDGVGQHEPWVTQYQLDHQQVLEIQAGPLVDQSIKEQLQPGQTRWHTQFWIPTDSPRNIYRLELPRPKLVPAEQIPQFSWARPQTVALWLEAIAACAANSPQQLPAAPDATSNQWAPSGLDELGDALPWATQVTTGTERDRWLLQLGAWHAGRDAIDPALRCLTASGDDRARALAGRLYRRCKRDIPAAMHAYTAIESPVFALHPQVVCERDLALAAAGPSTLPERERWLAAISASDDEWVIERRAVLLLDQGNIDAAKMLIENTKFQLVHQRYARTRLWQRIRQARGATGLPPPNWLGEDDLFEFGAYREYQED